MKIFKPLKLINCLIFFVTFCEISGSENSNKMSKLATATNLVIAEAFHSHKIVSLIFSESSKNFVLLDFIDELLTQISKPPKHLFQLESSIFLSTVNSARKRCSIIVINSFDDFLAINQIITPKNFKPNGQFLIVLIGSEIVNLEEMFKLLWEKQIYNVNIMFEDKSSDRISVKTFMPFSNKICNNTKPVLINEFINGKFVSQNFFPDKMKNLRKCVIKISLTNSFPPFVIMKSFNNTNSNYSLKGLDSHLLNGLSEALNFTINFAFIGAAGYLHANGSSKGPFKLLLDNEAEMCAGGWIFTATRLKFFDFTTVYYEGVINFVVPPGRDFTSIEKLIYPFKFEPWICILVVFIVGIFVILIVNRQSKIVQQFVFGNDVKNPLLNMFYGFIGGSQKILPKFNFARFILMSFLLYSIVIRTLYQGSVYNLLKSDKRHESAQTIDEMIKRDYKFYFFESLAEIFQSSDKIRNRFSLELKSLKLCL
jgi:hypothetical protein